MSDFEIPGVASGSGLPSQVGQTGEFLSTNGTVASWEPLTGGGDMVLLTAQTNSGLKTFLTGTFGLRNVANTFTALFSNAITAARTYTLKDADGTIAFTSDITGVNSGTNTGDQTTIAGITGTLAQFNTAVTDADLARTDAANTFTGVQTMTLPALTTPAITGLATGSGVASAPTVSTLVSRDSAGISAFVNVNVGYNTTVTAAGSTAISNGSAQLRYFTGTSTHTLALPDVTTLTLGQRYQIVNDSTGNITVNSSGVNLVATVLPGTTVVVTCILITGATAASWSVSWLLPSTVPLANGGTGLTSIAARSIWAANATNTLVALTPGAGQSIRMNAGNTAWEVYTPVAASGITWSEVTDITQAGVVNAAYVTNNAALVTVTIPDTAAVGDILRVVGKGAGGWRVSQNAAENINYGVGTTTTGIGGYLASTARYDSVELVCTVANTTWTVSSSIGNITFI